MSSVLQGLDLEGGCQEVIFRKLVFSAKSAFWGDFLRFNAKRSTKNIQRGMNFTCTVGGNNVLLSFFLEGVTLSQVQRTNDWFESSNLTYASAYCYSLILNEATLS